MLVSQSTIESWDPTTIGEFAAVVGTPFVSAAVYAAGWPAVIEGGKTLLWNVLRLAGLACSDADCGNEASSVAKLIEGKSTLIKQLPDEIAATFEKGQYQGRILQQSLTVYRAEGTTFGRWFGTVKPDSAANAERLYNITNYGNDVLQVSSYRIYAGTTIYEGQVAGGTDWQIFIEDRLNGFVQILTTQPLPQWGF